MQFKNTNIYVHIHEYKVLALVSFAYPTSVGYTCIRAHGHSSNDIKKAGRIVADHVDDTGSLNFLVYNSILNNAI